MSTALILEPFAAVAAQPRNQRKKKVIDERGKATEYYVVVVFE